MSIFKIPLPAWFYKENAVLKGAIEAREEIDAASTPDKRRAAEQKLVRYEHAAKRLKEERAYRDGIIRLLLTKTTEEIAELAKGNVA
jgi:hypothetical protein